MKLDINSPCTADWNQMKIGLKSRHCDLCQKNVVDFTSESKEDILLYFLQNKSSNTCGRFRKSQLDYYHIEEMITIKALNAMPTSKAFMVLALACLSLSAMAQTPVQSALKNNAKGETFNTPIPFPLNASEPDSTVKDSVNCVPKQKVENANEVIMGDIITGEVAIIEVEQEPELTQANFYATQNSTPSIYTVVEKMPEFPGGIDGLFLFLKNETKYPQEYQKAKVEGKVYARFIVNEDGSVQNPEILRSISGYPKFDQEVLRVIKKMPHWTPGQQNGKNVKVYYTLPFNFKL